MISFCLHLGNVEFEDSDNGEGCSITTVRKQDGNQRRLPSLPGPPTGLEPAPLALTAWRPTDTEGRAFESRPGSLRRWSSPRR